MATNVATSNIKIEMVDFNQDLTIQYATIPTLFESQSPERQTTSVETQLSTEDEIRRFKGTIIDTKTNKIVHTGSFFPYEYISDEKEKCEEKMALLNHKFEDMNIQYSYEGTVIRIFYHCNKWYVSTHRKLDAARSKWGSDKSFKFLFEEALKESYNLTLTELFSLLNLRCQYTFMLMADENTRFVCQTNHHSKKVYFLSSTDPEVDMIKINFLPKPDVTFNTLNDAFNFVDGMVYPFLYQGLLLVHINGSQYRIINKEYANLFKVRNNEQSIPYRYLQLKTQNNQEAIENLKMLYPQHIPTFESHDKNVEKLVDIIYQEYTLRKQRNLLPADLTTVAQIDQKLYLFIKNRLFKFNGVVTPEIILELLWMEEPSNINHMIRMVKYNQRKEIDKQKLIVNLEMVNTPTNNIALKVDCAPKKKKIKYVKVPIEFSEFRCRKRLF
jgi:hypothetical protein